MQNLHLLSQNSVVKNEILAIHPKIGLLYNIYSSDFNQFENSVDCGLFKSGSGFGWIEGIAVEFELSQGNYLSTQFALSDRSGNFSLNNYFPSRNLETGKVDTVHTLNELETSLYFLEIQPDFRIVVEDDFINGPLRLLGGLRIGIPIITNFSQKESIVSPTNAVFIGPDNLRSQERTIATGKIVNANPIEIGLSLGVENLLKIGKKNFLSQALIFDYNFTNVVNDIDWMTYAFRFEVGLRFSIQGQEPVVEPEPVKEVVPEPEPVKIVPPVLTPTLTHSIIQADNLRIETGNELLATIPIINSVFFEQNSFAIPSFYLTKDIKTDYFEGNPVAKHSYLLPRIAEIVKKNPNAKIELESSTSGNQNESDPMNLSKARAEAVKNALINLGISDKLIAINTRVAPRFPSNQDFKEGIEENQRVEIIVKNAPIQEYVDLQKYANLNGFIDVVVSYKDLKESTKISLENNLTAGKVNVNRPGNYKISIDERINTEQSKLEFKTHVSSDEMQDSKVRIIDLNSLEKNVVDINLDNFTAYLTFNYNSSDLSDDNKGLLRQLADKLPDGATIVILGSADFLGSSERNAVLENERAEKTQKYIQSISGSKFKFETGRSSDKFDEITPQGRFLNRSIKIKVKK